MLAVLSFVVGGGCDWRTDGDDSRTEFDSDGHVVVLDKTAFAEADGERGFTGAAVADADEFCDVIPWLLGHCWDAEGLVMAATRYSWWLSWFRVSADKRHDAVSSRFVHGDNLS